MTDKEKFSDYMKKQGFAIANDGMMGTLSLIPHHRISDTGEHTLIREIMFVVFDGSDTPKGKLGCVTLFYHGMSREKYRREANLDEILKKAFCPKTLDNAIETFIQWKNDTTEILNSWKVII